MKRAKNNINSHCSLILVVRVEDYNDNAPSLVKSDFTIMENSPPARVGELVAIDADDYTKGKFKESAIRYITRQLVNATRV